MPEFPFLGGEPRSISNARTAAGVLRQERADADEARQAIAGAMEQALTVRTVELPCSPAAVGEGRRFVDAFLVALGLEAVRDDATLLTSELLTNTFLRSHTAMRLVITVAPDEMIVEVSDGARAQPPRRVQRRLSRGLRVVDTLAEEWHEEQEVDGRTMWFSLLLPDRVPRV